MKASDELLISMNTLKINMRRLFLTKKNSLQNDAATKVYRGTANAQADWFQQIHGDDAGSVIDNQKGSKG